MTLTVTVEDKSFNGIDELIGVLELLCRHSSRCQIGSHHTERLMVDSANEAAGEGGRTKS